MVLDAMLRRTPLIPYLQQMQQLISERVALQVNPVTLPPGASYRGPTPVLPKNLEGNLPSQWKGQVAAPVLAGSAPPTQADLWCQCAALVRAKS